jgi:hypothetical protein
MRTETPAAHDCPNTAAGAAAVPSSYPERHAHSCFPGYAFNVHLGTLTTST